LGYWERHGDCGEGGSSILSRGVQHEFSVIGEEGIEGFSSVLDI
jgi:hypothetical protein